MSFAVRDEEVQLAFRFLKDNALPAAAARADRERRADLLKAAKARAYLSATGTAAEREAAALLTDDYVAAAEGYYAAIELDEEYRNLRSQAEQVIEVWRSVQANRRASGKLERDWQPVE